MLTDFCVPFIQLYFFFFSSRRRHTRCGRDWSSDVCSSDLSTDSFFSHKAWADALGLKHTLLADFKREVVKKFGLYFEPLNCGQRATVIVDKNGKVAYVKVQEIKVARDDKDILEALKKLH